MPDAPVAAREVVTDHLRQRKLDGTLAAMQFLGFHGFAPFVGSRSV